MEMGIQSAASTYDANLSTSTQSGSVAKPSAVAMDAYEVIAKVVHFLIWWCNWLESKLKRPFHGDFDPPRQRLPMP